MAEICEYADFLRLRQRAESPAAAPSRIPDTMMSRVLIPSVVFLEALWISLVSYLGLSFWFSLLS